MGRARVHRVPSYLFLPFLSHAALTGRNLPRVIPVYSWDYAEIERAHSNSLRLFAMTFTSFPNSSCAREGDDAMRRRLSMHAVSTSCRAPVIVFSSWRPLAFFPREMFLLAAFPGDCIKLFDISLYIVIQCLITVLLHTSRRPCILPHFSNVHQISALSHTMDSWWTVHL